MLTLCLPRAINDRPYKSVAAGDTNIFCNAKYIISEATSFIIHHSKKLPYGSFFAYPLSELRNRSAAISDSVTASASPAAQAVIPPPTAPKNPCSATAVFTPLAIV